MTGANLLVGAATRSPAVILYQLTVGWSRSA
jgi:hypothetical protein